MIPGVQHEASSGPTRCGKSYQKWAWLRPQLRLPYRHRPSIWLFDPAGSISKPLGADAVRAGVPLLYDEVAEFSRTPGYPLIVPSSNADELERESENNVVIEDLVVQWVRPRGVLNAQQNPNIQDALMALGALAVYQRVPPPILRLRDAFFLSADQDYLLANCTREEAIKPFLAWNELPPREWEFRCGAGQRIIREWLREPALYIRDRSTFDIPAFVNKGGIWIGDGASKEGKISRKAVEQVFHAVLLMLLSMARRGLFNRRLLIILDEGKTGGLITPHVTRGLAESGKWGGGVEMHLLFQNLETLDPEAADDITQNCVLRYFKQMSPVANRRAAEILAVPGLDPLLLKRTVERTRKEYVGQREEEVQNTGEWENDRGEKGKSRNRNIVSRPVYQDRTDVTEELYSLEDQIKLEQQRLSRKGVGEARVRRWEGVYDELTPEQLPAWEGRLRRNGEVVPLWQVKLEKALEALRAGPMYRNPRTVAPPPPSTSDSASRLDNDEL